MKIRSVSLPEFVTLFLTSLAQIGTAFAAASEPLKILSVGPEEPLATHTNPNLRPPPIFEIPPVQVDGAPGLIFASTSWSWLCKAPASNTDFSLIIDANTCSRFSVPARFEMATGASVSPEEAAARSEDWARSYNGVFSALKMPQSWLGRDLLVFIHGENKNERFGTVVYANTVATEIDPEKCASGSVEGRYSDCWPSYNGFINLGLADTTHVRTSPIDLGPVIWPAMGYRQDGKKTSGGVRHPSVIRSGNQLYIFYLDSSTGTEPGRRGGLRVARMQLPTNDDPIPAVIPWFNGAFNNDNKSLPAGFAKENIRSFFDKRGGKASELWSEKSQTTRFSVAQVAEGEFFIGAEEYILGQQWGIQLRTSYDLVHWSKPVELPAFQVKGGWDHGTFHYPVFSNLDGSSPGKINLSNFYLIGTGKSGRVVRRKISVAP